ncbi:DUF5642 family protein [Mycolicibacterium sp. BiH015]|uniref:DUF5642 family protein n=1 Tax=Mycolicibacterium sp. BiH015 TaxID=3018808 RepID=UPI0022E0A295|nr:DUF5642 family protein [Mycolicibacterium sp. BiH015]MDA2894262.1 DUF5642 family protein [Mycolicibacterium sp. BiH015]
MRLTAACVPVLLCAACAQPSPPPPPPVSEAPANLTVNPARIDRARHDLPAGYEVTGYTGAPTPFAAWGFRSSAVSDPVQCAALGAPAVDAATMLGWTASGPGGIVYAIVANAGPDAAPDPAVVAACGRWTVTSGPSTATVTGLPGPHIAAADTVGMSTAVTTVVEGGTETRSHAETFVAYLGGYVCFVAVVTDPGSPQPALEAESASDLLTKTVSTLRG